MPFNNNGDTRLNVRKISLLYRHARLAKALKLSVEEFIQVLHLNFAPTGLPITALDQIYQLNEFRDWLKSSPFSVYELRFIVQGKESNAVKYTINSEGIVELVKDIQKQNPLFFGEELLAEIEKISPEDSRKILVQMSNDNFIIASAEGYRIDPVNYRLTQDFSSILATSGVSAEVRAQEPEIREKLNEFHPFVISFTSKTNIGKELYHQLVKFINVDMGSDDFINYLQATFDEGGVPENPGDLDILLELSKEIERTMSLFEKLKFELKAITYITKNPAVLGIADLKDLTVNDLKAMVLYKKLISLNQEAESSVQKVLNNYQAKSTFSEDEVHLLAEFWQEDKSLLDSLIRSLTLSTVPIQALAYLKEGLDICRTLGINGFSLQKLADDGDFTRLSTARDIALGAFSSKYEDENIRQEKLEPYQDRINVIKRDALCDYIIARERELKFKDSNDIYAFFLLDVEMNGCFRISRLVCAISSLQLYVHRVLTNLEQSASDGCTVLNKVKNLSSFKNEWEWRKNYRVWEANRKVFLYPENYLEPDLRDNKTPIFKELEDELLQQKITKESAESAYKKYISQFTELARLRITGNYCHEESNKNHIKKSNTYYFFGRTQQDPPQYYYRTWDEKLWTPWEKIELGINSNYVSAVIHLGKLYLFWVEIKTTEKTDIIGGNSSSSGYTYDIDILYSFLNENGRWIPPQRLDVYHQGEPYYDEIYSAIYKNNDFEKQRRYKRLYPGVTQDGHLFAYVLFPATVKGGKINLFLNAIHEVDLLYDEGKYLYSLGIGEYLSLEKNQSEEAVFRRGTVQFYTAALHDATLISKYEHNLSSNSNDVSNVFDDNIHQSDIDIVHNKKCDYIIKIGNQQYLAQWKDYRFFHARGTVRLSTSLIDALGESLFTKGLENFLSLETQSKTEHSIGIDLYWPWRPPYNNNSHIDFRGAYGEYYRELFFHIPFLIANHLNANQKFKEAKWWYERIFDPTASESPDDENPIDRNWRYIEFKDVSLQTMKENLTDKATIEQYKTDPFSPHAIARMRLSAYQKGIVMKYIDNLLDWGDSLFAMDTMESINEATMLYVLASDILGKRPAQLGKCETVKDTNLTYEKIGPEMDKEVDILLCLENWNISISDEYLVQLTAAQDAGSSSYEIFPALSASLETEIGTGFAAPATSLPGRMDLSKITPQYQMRSYQEIVKEKGRYQQLIADLAVLEPHLRYPAFEVTGQSKLVFCVPPNYDLLKYWDRVEDRLFKIRNCMNISGVRRQLALFQPPINPMALVRAKAAGLSLEDILTMLEAQIPPYRFSYLIEKAKQYTQTVQAFGSALLIALEKRDVEELTLLRSVHERNILRETKEIKKQQLQEAQYQYQVIVETKTNVQNRINYYQGLIDEGLIVWENVQLISKHAGTVLMAGETVLRLTSGITYLVPQVGSPFAMKFGGKEIGDSQLSLSELSANLSRICDAISASAGLEASYQRREQEWGHQLLLAQQELKQVEQQRLSADIRQLIAEKDLEIHEKNMEQADELHDFYKNKFTSLGLYNYLSTTLNRLYREAYNMAYDMAKMAERTYRFERDEDDAIFITGDNWQFDRAGLLAGERLLLQLQHMERAYLEQNKRDYEVTQSFSLALMDPSALLKLREKGSCDFPIPEIIFDLFYPGQYKRLIKSVRVTIPCITGSYTNVSATLTLTGSYVRKEKSIDLEDLILKPNQESTSIATSNAQNDGGLFELNFRDERYLPFEGAGAISTWKLELPDKLRPFNYDTISDVIIHISYTARYDGEFRKIVEKNVLNILSNSANNECLFRLLSLKHEFPDAFYKLLNPSGTTQTTEFELTRQHFPQFLAGKDLSLSEMRIYLKPKGKEKVTTSGLVLKINNSPPIDSWNDFIVTSEEGDLKESIVSATYNPIRNWTIDTVSGGLNKEEIDDIMILLKYKIIL